MSCNRCANQAQAAMGLAGVPANQAQATWAGGDDGIAQPGHCPVCGAFLTAQGQCQNPDCSAATDPTQATDYVITADDRLDAGGTRTKYRRNVAAIELLKRLEAEDRPATPGEQAVLVRYAGWGGLPKAFQPPRSYRAPANSVWPDRYRELKEEVLGPEEWDSARASTPNAHYTAPEVITAMWEGLRRLGFQGGRVLEPAAGVGHFFGLTPPDVAARSTRVAVELDEISARITARLYPGATVHSCGFERAPLPDNFFDVAVSNVPFGNYPVHDPALPRDKRYLSGSIHNYFFAKALDKVRPGGVVAFVTSRYTMDGKDSAVREYLASQADLLGAVRLPNTAFKRMANTEVTTDIIFLRKRAQGDPPGEVEWTRTVHVTLPRSKGGRSDGEAEFPVNEYFVANPDMMLGELQASGTMYGRYEVQLVPADDGGDLEASLSAAVAKLPCGIMKTSPQRRCPSCGGFLSASGRCNNPGCSRNASLIAPPGLVAGGAFGDDGRARRGAALRDVAEEDQERLAGMVAVRDAAREVLRLNVEGGGDEELAEAQGALNAVYDEFVAEHGPLSQRQNRKALEGDPDLPFLLALEKDYDPRAKIAVKAQIFFRRTIRLQARPDRAETAKDALLVSLSERGDIDWERIEELTRLTPQECRQQLAGEIYQDPERGWVTADVYLSGDVKSKLAAAEAAAAIEPAYEVNVAALREVQPPDLLPSEIHAGLGSPWIPPDVITAFGKHLFNQTLAARYVPTLAEWTLAPQYYRFNRSAPRITRRWGVDGADGVTLLDQVLNGRQPRVTVPDPTNPERRVVDRVKTLAAREMQDKIKREFIRWAWSDPGRAERLARMYNDRFNRTRLRKYDGSHLTLPGLGARMPDLRPSQKDAIWRIVQSSGNTLLAHRVGAGKTFALLGAGMELRRLGLRNKVMHVIPNHMLEQYGEDARTMYPSAKVLLISSKDLGARRAETMSRIATEDWDAVVVTHSAFGKLGVSVDTHTSFIRQEMAKLDAELEAIEQEGDDDDKARQRSVKRIEKAKKRMQVRLEKYAAAHEKDKTVTFEQLGVDHICVDEADRFKNLYFPTRRTDVAGIAQSHSIRAFDMYMKTQYLQRHCGTCGRFVSPDGVCKHCLGRTTHATGGVTFATGTPISNSVVEMFTMMRYLMPARLRELGLDHFDAWASMFGDTVTAIEMAPSGDGYREKTRFARFDNVPELLRMFGEVADVAMDPVELGLKLPRQAGGGAIAVSAPPSEELKDFIQACARRAERLRETYVDPSIDNMLKIVGEANLAALDMRLIDPDLPDNPDSKVNRAVENVLAVYEETTGVEVETGRGIGIERGIETRTEIENMAQVVFLDVSTPKPGKFNVYDDVKAKLIAGGIPEHEIAFIHDARNDAARQRLFDRVNAGQVRVILGSTEKMGSGTNIQRRLAALHHLDAPWRPRDVEQREGRILRPGNVNPEVKVFRYVTEESFDVYKWQLLQSKARFIAQVMTGDMQERSMEDIDAITLGYAEMKALATGNPVIIEQIKVNSELQRLLILRRAHRDKAIGMTQEIGRCSLRIEYARANVARLQRLKAVVDDAPREFQAVFGGQAFDRESRRAAGDALMEVVGEAAGTYKELNAGTLRGFPVVVEGQGSRLYPRARVLLAPDEEVIIELGDSPTGNLSRLMRAVDSMDGRIGREREAIADWETRIRELKVEVDRPFEREGEIGGLTARLTALAVQIALLEKGGKK